MSKHDLVKRAASVTGTDWRIVRKVFDALLSELERSIVQGKLLDIRGFGTFAVVIRAARPTARNPKKPDMLFPVPAKPCLRFRAGKRIAERIARMGK